jgi:hypothetical protein
MLAKARLEEHVLLLYRKKDQPEKSIAQDVNKRGERKGFGSEVTPLRKMKLLAHRLPKDDLGQLLLKILNSEEEIVL